MKDDKRERMTFGLKLKRISSCAGELYKYAKQIAI